MSALREALKGSDVALIQAGMNTRHGDAVPRVHGRLPGVRAEAPAGMAERRTARPRTRDAGPRRAGDETVEGEFKEV